ncbi:hypothetical protein Syun_008010 [Stephania yunnanensis]|uniref:Uncharacterized protein n=1 Tax=Stephania yunnanensis TaxID=152371 RepID=A0AAP0L3B9_9MAGN
MDGVAANSYKGLKSYFRRRDYHRLDGSTGRRRRRSERIEVAAMGPSRPKSRFFIRFKPKLKLKLRFRFLKRLGGSPKKLLVRLRDAYVRMMLSFANSTVFTTGLGGVHGGGGFGRAPLKEYDEKMILEIYASLMIQKKLNVVDNNNNCITGNSTCSIPTSTTNRLATVPEISTDLLS